MTDTDEYYLKISNLVQEVGVEETSKILGIKQESVTRRIREAKVKGIFKDAASDIKSKHINKILENYSEAELRLIADAKSFVLEKSKKTNINFEGKSVKIGVMTDTHIGHLKFFPERVYAAFEEFKKEKVDFWCHVGDVTEGMSHRPGHIYELTHLGYEAQKKYAVEIFGQWTDTPIYAISGNHDQWYIKSNGANIVGDIDKELSNFHFIGHDEADILLNSSTSVRLWHGGDGSCFDEGTEILTKDGFIDFKDLTKEHQVATMSKEDHIFEWQNPTHITNEPYEGKMLNFKHRCFNFNVTPKHGLWVEYNKIQNKRKEILTHPTKSHNKLRDDWFRLDAQEVSDTYRRQKYRIPNSVNGFKDYNDIESISIPRFESKNIGMIERMNHVGELDIKTVAQLIAWYVTEGHATKRTVCISQFKKVNPENHSEIVELAKKLHINYYENDKGITLHSTELSSWLIELCGHKSTNKFLPDFIKEGKKEILEIVLQTMIKGDGWNRGKEGSLGYVSKSKRLSEDVGLIALKLGYAVNYGSRDYITKVNKLHGTIYTTYIVNTQKNPSINKKPTEFNYKGNIYCCEVPNGLIYVRKNGKCFWSHNSYALSYRVQKILESLQGGDKPNVMFCGHTHKYVKLFERNVHAISAGCIEDQTSFMRGKRLAANPGFGIYDITFDNTGVKKLNETFYPFY